MVDTDHPGNIVRIAGPSPTGHFPALVDGAAELSKSSIVIEDLDRTGDAPPLVPRDRATALRARMKADVFDEARPYRPMFPPGATDRD